MAQTTIEKEMEQNSFDIDSLVLETPKTTIKEKPKENQKKFSPVNLKKINKTLLKIAKKAKYNNNYIHTIDAFKMVKQKPVYRNYFVY